jgi:protein SCO1/2
MRYKAILPLTGLLAVALFACGPQAETPAAVPKAAVSQDEGATKTADVAPIGGRFILRSHTGKVLTDQDFKGQFLLISFGYTTCPDVCPTTLVKLAEVDQQLGDLAKNVQVLFISVDPDRDTPDVLENYVTSFDPAFIGLSGSKASIDSVTKKYRVKYAFVDRDFEDDQDYSVDHTASVFFMGPEGEYIGRFSYPTPADEIARRVRGTIRGTASSE